MAKGCKKVSVDIPDDLFKQLTLTSNKDDRPIASLIRLAVKKYLARI